MNVRRLLPLACVSLILVAASPGEARSPFENARTFGSVSHWLRSFVSLARGASSWLAPDPDRSSATPIVTWGRIKDKYREGGPPPGGKD